MSEQSGNFGWVVAGIFGLLLLGQCSSSDDNSDGDWSSTTSSGSSANGEARYIDASTANCRSSPSTDGAIQAKLPRGQKVNVTESEAGWRLVDRFPDDCWVSGDLLAVSQPAPEQPPILTAYQQPEPAPRARSVYYRNCSAARAAGAAPVYRGDPGYASHLDRDNDGIGCE